MVLETIDAHLLVEGDSEEDLQSYLKIINSLSNSKQNRLFIIDDSKPIIPKTRISHLRFDYPYTNHTVQLSKIEYALESMDFYQIISMVDLDEDQLNICASNVRDGVYFDEEFYNRIQKSEYQNRLNI